MIKENNKIVQGQQYESISGDPKNKSEDKKEKVLNGQDDNSYDESEETTITREKLNPAKQADKDKDFEYSDSGEFQNDSFVTDTNPNDDYL